jgi:hypothetical protein
MERLAELLEAWSDCLTLLRHLEDDASVQDDRTRTLLARPPSVRATSTTRWPLHRPLPLRWR